MYTFIFKDLSIRINVYHLRMGTLLINRSQNVVYNEVLSKPFGIID